MDSSTNSSIFSSFHNASTSRTSVILSSTTSVLSMLGTILIILTYFTWKEIRTSSRRILVYISIADFFTAFGNMFSVLHVSEIPASLCVVQSFVTTTSSLWSFFWSTFMAGYLFCTVALRKPVLAEKLLLGFHVIAWGVPLVITGTALGLDALGNDLDDYSAGWCWIKDMKDKQLQLMWMLVTGKGWEITTYILIVVFYAALKFHIHRDINYRHEQFTTVSARHAAIKADKKLTFVPLVFILCRIWGTVRFLISVTNYNMNIKGEHGLEWLVYLQGIGDSAQGFANFMLFCFFTEKFQNRFRQICCPCMKPFQRSVQESSTSSPQHESIVRPRTPINENTSLLGSVKQEP